MKVNFNYAGKVGRKWGVSGYIHEAYLLNSKFLLPVNHKFN